MTNRRTIIDANAGISGRDECVESGPERTRRGAESDWQRGQGSVWQWEPRTETPN